tara:strand:+ start:812 stop:2260 length:1449 start_codon:yes stop_codon:yes gene_type:complete
MAESMLANLLRTPKQIREEELLKMQQQAAAQAQLGGVMRGQSSALPGIFSSVMQQQRPALATDIAQTARGLTQGIGSMLGATGAKDLGKAVSQATVSPEERQAAQAQGIMAGLDQNDPASLRQTAQKLSTLGLTGAADSLNQNAINIEDRARRQKSEDKQEVRADRQTALATVDWLWKSDDRALTTRKRKDLKAIAQDVPYDAKDPVKYYNQLAQKLYERGYQEEGDKALTNAREYIDTLTSGSDDSATMREYNFIKDLTKEQKEEFFRLKRGAKTFDNGQGIYVLNADGTARKLTPKYLDPEDRPENIKAQAVAQAAGTELGKIMALDATDISKRQANAQNALALIDRLLSQKEGMANALGAIDRLTPTASGSAAAIFESDLAELQAKNFLEAIKGMVGMGSLSEEEGKKLTTAYKNISLDLSETAMIKRLGELKNDISAGVQRSIELADQRVELLNKIQNEMTGVPTQTLVYDPVTGTME